MMDPYLFGDFTPEGHKRSCLASPETELVEQPTSWENETHTLRFHVSHW